MIHKKEIPLFRPEKQGLEKLLGELEAAIMELIWSKGVQANVTVREVHEELAEEKQLAYTTVMTVMGNLAKKGFLKAEKSGLAYLYSPASTKEEFLERAVGKIIDELLSDFAVPALTHFSKVVKESDLKKIQSLSEKLKKKK